MADRAPDVIADVAYWSALVNAPSLTAELERAIRAQIAAEIEAFADDDSDVSDAYRHAAMIAKGTL